jgi:tetratricopeptide (TPR) repeat protein
MAERLEAMITPFPPIRLSSETRLRKLNHQQPKATVADVPLDRPVDLIVLATKTTGATCRLQGREGVLTLHADLHLDVVPGRILAVKPDRVWSHNGNTYLSGERVANRFDAAALGLIPLGLEDWGSWDPKDEYWGDEDKPLERWARPIVARGPRPSFELEACLPGKDPEGWDSDPIHESIDLWNSGKPVQALRVLEAVCRADLRCLDAHAHLGSFLFDRFPEQAVLHYEVGVGIGQVSLGPAFDGVLPWGCLDNRPFLRCLHGYGLCLWRLGFFREAKRIFERMLWLNPSDNQGVRFILPEVRAKRDWQDYTDKAEGRG